MARRRPSVTAGGVVANTGSLARTDFALEQVRRRAYEIYLARGQAPGDALSDWLEAESELRSVAADKPEEAWHANAQGVDSEC